MSAGPVLTFVIPVRNDAARLRRCLTAIHGNLTTAPFEVVVADNGSDDDSAQVAAAAGATVLSLPGVGVAELRNVAARHTTAPLIAFVDADHEIDERWIESALDACTDGAVAAAGAPYSVPADANRIQRAYGRLRRRVDAPEPVAWLASGNMIVRRAAFDRLGGFDTRLEACEDVDFCNRLSAAGYRLIADPRLRSVHLGDPSTLRAVFRGELWRGRNNLFVTLRGPITPGALVSLLVPIVELLALATVAATPILGWIPGALAAFAFLALVAARTARMSAATVPVTLGDVLDNLRVALAYDAARALALVFRATHRTRREPLKERAVA